MNEQQACVINSESCRKHVDFILEKQIFYENEIAFLIKKTLEQFIEQTGISVSAVDINISELNRVGLHKSFIVTGVNLHLDI